VKSFRDPVDEWLKATVGNDANPMITNLGHLTDLQYDFSRAYVLCGSAQKAAERVGMPNSHNPNLLIHLPKIAACINILTAKREQQLGKKTSAEITERLLNTPLFESDDFGVSEAAVKEREALLGKPQQVTEALKNLSDTALAENLLNPSVDQGIMQLPKVQVAAATSFGPAWIIERLVTIAERSMQIEPVFDKKGRPIGQFQFNPQAALKAMEMLGRTMAMFRDKVEITGELSSFKADELDDRIMALVAEHPGLAKVIEAKVVKPEKVEEVA
jgi:hypothetical protein